VETLRLSLLFLHLIGLALLLGGFVVQLRAAKRRITGAMLLGTVTMVVTGPALVSVRRSLDLPVLDAKIGTKAMVVAVLASVAIIDWFLRGRQAWTFYAVGSLAVANLAIAVFWT